MTRVARARMTAALALVLGLVAGVAVGTLPSRLGDDEQPAEEHRTTPASRLEDDGPRVEGYRPQAIDRLPYAEQSLLDLDSPTRPADENGVQIYERDGERHIHPVGTAQYGLAALSGWHRTGNEEYLDRAVANADALIDIAVPHDGGIYFPYTFDFPLGGVEEETIQAPWWSAMAQGQALSLFVRLHEELGEERFTEAAHATFATFDDYQTDDDETPFTLYQDRLGYLWFEEYAGNTDPLLVLNGHVFAIYGLYDYHRMTGSTEAAQLFDAGATTVRWYIDDFRIPGDVSYYCLRRPFCAQPLWQNPKYHRIHASQLDMLTEMTGDHLFAGFAELFRHDTHEL